MSNKSIFIGFALVICNNTLQAQPQQSVFRLPGWCANPRYEAALTQLSGLNATRGAAGKGTATSQRLTGMTNYRDLGSGLQGTDTTWYRYGSIRTSRFDLMYLYYNTVYSYNTFKPDNEVNFDTSYAQGVTFSGTPTVTYKVRNAAGKVTHFSESGYQLTNYSYNAQGLPDAMVTQYYDNIAGTWSYTNRTGYRHDSQGLLVSDTASVWDNNTSQWKPDVLRLFSHNALGRPTQVDFYGWNGASFTPSSRLQIKYTATSQFSTITNANWYGAGYFLINRDSFAYGAGDAIIYHVSQSMYNAGLTTVVEESRHLNAANLPDSITMFQLNDPVARTYDTYYMRLSWNSFGNPVTQSTRRSSRPVPDQVQRYYYTNFETTDIAAVPVRRALGIYPNPADQEISIRTGFSGDYSLSIVNAAGQLVQRSTGSATAGQPVRLPLDNLHAGTYWLRLRTASGEEYAGAFSRK